MVLGNYFEHGPAVQVMLFKDFYTFISGSNFVQRIRTIWSILVEGPIKNICVKCFEI